MMMPWLWRGHFRPPWALAQCQQVMGMHSLHTITTHQPSPLTNLCTPRTVPRALYVSARIAGSVTAVATAATGTRAAHPTGCGEGGEGTVRVVDARLAARLHTRHHLIS